MILSIVTGTYNRQQYLRRMMESARKRIPRGIPYQFVIVDGGSTDGTLDYLRTQPDVLLLEHGALYGAIRAFTEGGELATGEYVILANDDIEFTGESIVKALVYLEQTPHCAAVAFADDRPAPGYGEGYKVQHIEGHSPAGERLPLVYAQVGMYRRELAKQAGWWGWHDRVMSEARTYGGDCYLSARLWEMGYTVDAVEGVQCNDLIVPDQLRAMNTADAVSKPSAYYQRYPNGVPIPTRVTTPEASERLRILYLPIFESSYHSHHVANKRGLREALAKQFLVYEADYVNDRSFDLQALVRLFKPHMLISQLHGTEIVSSRLLGAARAIAPEMVVVNWNGDVWTQNLTSPEMLELLRNVDVQLTVNANVLPAYEAEGIQAAYWQIGFEPVPERLPTVHHHDVVFLANCYSEERETLGRFLKGLPYDVGLYGYNWRELGDGFTLYDFALGAALYRSSKVAIGDNQYPNEEGFVSNRIFEALSNGAFLLHQHVEGLHRLTGLVEGTHYISWRDTSDLKKKLKYWLSPAQEGERLKIARYGEAYVRQHHSFDARVEELFTKILPKVFAHDPV